MDALDLIAKLKLDMSEYESGLNSASRSTKTMGSGMSSVFSKVAKVGLAALTTVSAAVVGFGATSVKTGAEFDSSMSNVAATMGKTMDELETEIGTVDTSFGEFTGNLREYAEYMGSNTEFSASQAADALNYMALAGYDVQTSMEMLPNVLNLASAGAMDLATASDMVTDTQTAFGISIDRTNQLVDEMAKAASTGNTSVEQLGDAFLTVGGLASELNGGLVTLSDGTEASVDGIQELEIALTAMADAGIKGSEAGTHMRNMLLKLSSPTSDGTAALEEMGVAVYDVEGNMRSLSDIFGELSDSLDKMTQEEKIQTISDLFNTRDLASAEAILNAVGEDWDEIGASILDAEGAASQMAETKLDNLSGDVVKFKSALEGVQITVSDELTPTLREFVQFGTSGLTQLKEAFETNGIDGAVETFGDILSDALDMIITRLPSVVDAASTIIESLVSGLVDNSGSVSTAMLNIVSTLISTISTIVPDLLDAGYYMIEDIATGIGNNSDTIISQIAEMISNIVSTISEHSSYMLDAGATLVMGLVNGVLNNVSTLITAGAEWVSNLLTGFLSALPDLISEIPSFVEKIGNALIDSEDKILIAGTMLFEGIIDAIPTIIGSISSSLPQIISTIVDVLLSGVDLVINAAITLLNGIIDAIPDIISAVATLIPSIITTVVEVLSEAVPEILDAAITLFSAILTAIPEIVTSLTSELPTLITTILDTLSSAVPTLLSTAISLFYQIVAAIPQIIPQINSVLPSVITAIVSTLASNAPQILEAGLLLYMELVNCLPEVIAALVASLPSVIDAITTTLSSYVNSMRSVGVNLLKGLWNGISDTTGWLKSQISGLGSTVINSIKSALGVHSPSTYTKEIGKYLAMGLGVGWDDEIDDVKDNIEKDMNLKGNIEVDSSSDFATTISSSGYSTFTESDISKLLSSLSINLYNTTAIDGNDIKKESYKYTVEKIGNETRAVRVATGGYY